VQQEETTYAEDVTSMAASSPGHYSAGHGDPTQGDFARDRDETRQTTGGGEGKGKEGESELDLDDSMLDSLNPTSAQLPMQSTPKAGRGTGNQGWADMESPYEALAKELTAKYGSPERLQRQQLNRFRQPPPSAGLEADSSTLTPPPPTTPGTIRRYVDFPDSPPLRPPARTPGVDQDAIMHRVLDKNWRLQATPLKPAPSRYRAAAAATPKPRFGRDFDSSPISSPPAPQLRTQIFTPRALRTPGAARFEAATALAGQQSVKGMGKASAIGKYDIMYDDDSDDDVLLPPGLSPKTMRFDLPPSNLIATPAKAASRRIVRDILHTAGAGDDDTMITDASSPPRRRGGMMDDDDPF